MDDKTWLGATAEAKAAAAYIHDRWDVFVQATGKAPFDLLVHKAGELRRVQVKGTASTNRHGSYVVGLKSVRPNRTAIVIKRLDPSMYDELAVYVEPEDRMVFMTPEEVAGRDSMTWNHPRLVALRSLPVCQCDNASACNRCP